MAKQRATAETPTGAAATAAILMLDPTLVLADDNSRFGLKQTRKESLMNSILEFGEVTTPVEVEERAADSVTAEHPELYRLTSGFYRHAAVAELNRTQGAGLMLPAIVKSTGGDSALRLKRQLAENMERENQSPMDKAFAMRKLLDAGVSRQEIRRIFSAPGGRKGLALQPLSNAALNIHLNMLDLPKTIQEKIHDGRVGVSAAYELGKVPADRRNEVLARAEADRQKSIDVEERDEEKFLAQEKKVTVAQEEAKAAEGEMAEAEATAANTAVELQLKTEKLRSVQRDPMGDGRHYTELDPKEKSQASERIKAAEADVKGAEKVMKETHKRVEVLKSKVAKSAAIAEEVKKKLEEARKPAKKGKPVSGKDVAKAAVAAGAQPVKLDAKEMRECIEQLASGEHAVPKVTQIGVIIKECFDGISTPKEMIAKLYTHMGMTPPKK